MKLHKWLEESTPEVIKQLTAVQHELEDFADGRDAVLAEQCNITQLLDDLIARSRARNRLNRGRR